MRNDILEQARAIRGSMTKVTSTLSDEQALEVKELYQLWMVNTVYGVGDVRRHNDKLFRCLQAHTSQVGWTPDAVPSLWVEVAPVGEYREIKDGMLPTEGFTNGEIGWYKTKDNLWKSIYNGINTWTPDTYPDGWEKVEEG